MISGQAKALGNLDFGPLQVKTEDIRASTNINERALWTPSNFDRREFLYHLKLMSSLMKG